MSMLLHKKQQIKTPSVMRNISIVSVVCMTSILSACTSMATDKSLCELKVLSLLIPRQSEEAVQSGYMESIRALKQSQEKLNQTMALVQKNEPNDSALANLLKDGQMINKNIDIIANNQRHLNSLYDYKLVVFEKIPGIQAEYNLLTDMMARQNYPSDQVIIAKNQVFIAERILRSINSLSEINEFSSDSMEDFLADFDVFNTYLQAQLNGNAELGVKRVNDAEMREGLLSIQEDIQVILELKAFNLLQKREPLASTYQAARENAKISDDMFIKLNRLERTRQ